MTTAAQPTQGTWQNVGTRRDIFKDIEIYEIELKRWLNGEVPDALFTEFRLRHGVYGQRQEGVQMIRIKLPLGMISVKQMHALADLSEELADSVSHITTRQDIQYHNVDIRNTPELMRRLAEVGITTAEACGNVVRNVCACTKTGVCSSELFDVTPDSLAMAEFLLKHPEAQDFGRKFKVSYSGCAGEMCGLANMHDIGAIAQIQEVDGKPVKGFKVLIGGGLGAVPRQARVLYDFVSREDMFIISQAIARIFTRHGERRNRSKARFKFVVDKFGIEETRRMLEEERAKIPEDEQRNSILNDYLNYSEEPLKDPSSLDVSAQSEAFQRWYRHNVEPQNQEGYSIAHVFLPLGDISGIHLRELAEISEKYVKDSVRLSVEQNIVFRWISNADLPAFYEDLKTLDLHDVANTLGDITACPGTDSCKLGISASRGLAATLHDQFRTEMKELGDNNSMKIKISGCPNSCGQHHIADLGFFGSAQSKGGKTAPVFQMVLGGTTQGNAESYGLAVGKISPHNIPEAIQRLNQFYLNTKEGEETFTGFVERIGKKRVKAELADLMSLPTFDERPDFFTDLRRVEAFQVNTGKGECAGELLPRTEFLLEECDRQNAQATLFLEDARVQEAYDLAKSSMEKSAKALLLTQGYEEFGDYETTNEFKKKFVDTSVFFSKYAAYFFKAAEEAFESMDEVNVRYTVEQATLFVEEANVVYSKIAQQAHASAGLTAVS